MTPMCNPVSVLETLVSIIAVEAKIEEEFQDGHILRIFTRRHYFVTMYEQS